MTCPQAMSELETAFFYPYILFILSHFSPCMGHPNEMNRKRHFKPPLRHICVLLFNPEVCLQEVNLTRSDGENSICHHLTISCELGKRWESLFKSKRALSPVIQPSVMCFKSESGCVCRGDLNMCCIFITHSHYAVTHD